MKPSAITVYRRKTSKWMVTFVLLAVVAMSTARELVRRQTPLAKRHPWDPKLGTRPFAYFGEANFGIHTLTTGIIGSLVLPSRVNFSEAERIMDEAIGRFPNAARAFDLTMSSHGPNPVVVKEPWRKTMRIFEMELNREGPLKPVGREGIRRIATEGARRVAALLEFYQRHIVSDDDVLDDFKLIFIVGNYRTATSMLHRTFGLDPRSVVFPQWAITAPISTPNATLARRHPHVLDADPNSRPGDIMRFYSREMAANVHRLHEMAPDLPDEEGLTWASDFWLIPGMLGFPALLPSGIGGGEESHTRRAIKDTSGNPHFRSFFLRQLPNTLRCWLHPRSPLWSEPRFQRARDESPERYLVLKAPLYATRLDLLRRSFPRAHFVATHREALDSVKSFALQLASLTPMQADQDRASLRDVARYAVDLLAENANGLVERREEIGTNLAFRDVSKDPVKGVERVWNASGISAVALSRSSSSSSSKKSVYEEAQQQRRRKREEDEKESLDEVFGIDFEFEVNRRMAEVFQRYRESFEEWL